jgi:tRNA1Val (adenine37-N6)-methyltransferase
MSHFSFKDFEIRQAHSPLKVSTDAILLGASVEINSPRLSILDVGTGNGVIALLLASRFLEVHITGLDPDQGAFQDAQFNFTRSKFASRLTAIKGTLASLPLDQKYDLIVSNPPYFIDSLPSLSTNSQQAKHLSGQAFFELLKDMILRCSDNGQIWLILPAALARDTHTFFESNKWELAKQIQFHANPNKPNKFWIMCFQKMAAECIVEQYTIRQSNGSYHADYRRLAGPFHDRQV